MQLITECIQNMGGFVFYTTQKKKQIEADALKDLTPMLSPDQILSVPYRQEAIDEIEAALGGNKKQFSTLVLPLINYISQYYQSLPETSHSYYALPGGLIDHALKRTANAARLFCEEAADIKNGVLSELQQLWQYALISASLLKGIGKLLVDFKVDVFDAQGHNLRQWNPLVERMITAGQYYRFEFEPDHVDFVSLRHRTTLLLARTLMPEQGFNWIVSNKAVLKTWLALLQEDIPGADTLGAILIHADALAIRFYFDAFMIKHLAKRGKNAHRANTFMDNTPKESSLGKEQLLGVQFLNWLQQALTSGAATINKSFIFDVPDGLLLTDEIFQKFLEESEHQKINVQVVKNAFLSLDIHGSDANGNTTIRYEHNNTHHIQSGTLFTQYAIALPNSVFVQNVYTGLVAPKSAIEFIHLAQFGHAFNRQQVGVKHTGLLRLNAKGEWIELPKIHAPQQIKSPKLNG